MRRDMIDKIKELDLRGRSGSFFPVSTKWESFKNQNQKEKYIICNGAEGEPDVFKDGYILENFPHEVVGGIKFCLSYFKAKKAFIYLRKDYYRDFNTRLRREIEDGSIGFKIKEDSYIAGEETAIINSIEGKRAEPKKKPPFPTEKGLWGYPTLIHNTETFYCISRIEKGLYEGERFFHVSGKVPNRGTFLFKHNTTIREALEKSGNMPHFPFFLQVGGGASGEIVCQNEIDKPVETLGSIKVFDKRTFNKEKLIKEWARFFMYGNCDKCTPCREGIYRIMELSSKGNLEEMDEMIEALEKSSFCPLGPSAARPFKSIKKIDENLS